MKLEYDVRQSYIYIAVSVILGPLIIFASEQIFPKKIACFDLESSISSYVITEGVPSVLHRDVVQQYLSSAAFILIGAGIMIALGIRLMASVYRNKNAISRRHKFTLISMIAAILLGYGLMIGLAALEFWCASN